MRCNTFSSLCSTPKRRSPRFSSRLAAKRASKAPRVRLLYLDLRFFRRSAKRKRLVPLIFIVTKISRIAAYRGHRGRSRFSVQHCSARRSPSSWAQPRIPCRLSRAGQAILDGESRALDSTSVLARPFFPASWLVVGARPARTGPGHERKPRETLLLPQSNCASSRGNLRASGTNAADRATV